MSDRPMLTVRECAHRLTVGEERVRRLCAAGEFGTKVGRDWRIDPEDLEAFIARNRRAPMEASVPSSLPPVAHPEFS